jgi:hypothetical protein
MKDYNLTLRNLLVSHTLSWSWRWNKKFILFIINRKLEIPNDEEDVNTREINKCDGQAHESDTMVAPLTPKVT